MSALLIKDGVVVNAIAVEDIDKFREESPEYCKQFDYIVAAERKAGSPGIGWLYDGKEFSAPPPIKEG